MKDALVLDVPTAVAAGDPTVIRNLTTPAKLFVTGTFVATFRVQVSAEAEGPEWFDVTANITAPGIVDIQHMPAFRARVNVTAYTSGTPAVRLCAHEVQGGR